MMQNCDIQITRLCVKSVEIVPEYRYVVSGAGSATSGVGQEGNDTHTQARAREDANTSVGLLYLVPPEFLLARTALNPTPHRAALVPALLFIHRAPQK
jgi:hypothetical protein